MNEVVNLTETKEFQVKALKIKLSPLPMIKTIEYAKELESIGSESDLAIQMVKYVELVHKVIHEENPEITLDQLKVSLSSAAAMQLIQHAMGSINA